MREFEDVYADYYTRIYKYVLCLCRNPSVAEEITQEAFFRACKSIGSFKGDCSISSWLCQIAKNCYYSYSKREKLRGHNPENYEKQDDGIEDLFIQRETAQRIHKVLHGLREPYKEVFWLKTFGELNYREIADLFGKSENWARVTYYRAKILIREEMK